MGCHTWFYKKIEVTEKEVKENVTDYLKGEIDFYDKLINRREEIDADILEAYPEWTVEFGQKYKPILERQLRMIEKGLCRVAMYNKYKISDYNNIHYFDKDKCTMYVSTDSLPHDTFRVTGYPEDRLYSLEDTLNFLETNNNIYYRQYINESKSEEELKEIAIERLKEFWKQHPDGMIKFG